MFHVFSTRSQAVAGIADRTASHSQRLSSNN